MSTMNELDKIIAEMRSGTQDDYVLGLADRLAAYRDAAGEPAGYLYWQRLPCGGGHWSYTQVFSKEKPLNITDPEPLYITDPEPLYAAPQPPRAEVEALERDAARWRWLDSRTDHTWEKLAKMSIALTRDYIDNAIEKERALLARRESGE